MTIKIKTLLIQSGPFIKVDQEPYRIPFEI